MAERQLQAAKIGYKGQLFFLITCYLPLATCFALDDPTEPPANYQAALGGVHAEASSDPRQRWLLTSTLISPQRRIAVMNGHAVKPGDTLDGVTVVNITPATVHLRDTQGEFSVTMQPATVKIPSGRPTTPQP